jgi:hypothetical protein
MPRTLKSVSKGYPYNTNYELEPMKFKSIIRLLEDSRDYLSKAYAAHIVVTLENNNFNVSSINEVLIKVLENDMNTRLRVLYHKRIYRG